MKAFRFRLERVLDWRKTQFEIEEHRLKEITAALGRVDRERTRLQAERGATEHAVRTAASIDGAELAAHATYVLRLGRTEEALVARRTQIERQVEAQRKKMIEARRRLRMIEKFKERRFAEWQTSLSRELEDLASESYLARWQTRKA
ncbi:MAG: hypothetical protein ABFD89_10195 [Bryobacteraceae bacterium]